MTSLVQYSDSDSDDADLPTHTDTKTSKTLKRKHTSTSVTSPSDLPPLPAAFHDLYSANARISTNDDPALHGGRKRAIPHIEGNWPTHLYLEWVPSQSESDHLLTLIETVRTTITRANDARPKPLPIPTITPSLRSQLGAPLPLHISLSRTLQLKTDARESFLETLTSRLRKASVKPFEVEFTSLKWVPNFQRNRWFLVLGTARPPNDELNRLLAACNAAAQQEGHQGLYTSSGGKGEGPMQEDDTTPPAKRIKSNRQPPSDPDDRTQNFHISIAWNLAEPDALWRDLVGGIDVRATLGSRPAAAAPFDAVKARVGNAVHSLPLGGAATSSLARRTGGGGGGGGGLLGLG
ncbi:hypothetical protein BU24DRAFT_350263 [Aaosphaeria arxii CBS 175.79]|uniref:U6 snRNA phosphodiesterase n=1 Tax=Aaosphaeria arxii CBS 175.79 TaxID=1450172 RepID=A0A6A5XJI6_9PLEO|nr:uncharacterized protein BU24DRAFT_350263 [Aaosphaeria arxii CBS 175.79]KAF2013438.1 hypothetical protein BU24DRAFT_350263 [Aaosphaeria arxii CBS 175.79]